VQITRDSCLIELGFFPNLASISSVAFHAEMSPCSGPVLPYFLRVLQSDVKLLITPLLSFLILSSLQEFVADTYLFFQLLAALGNVDVPATRYVDSSWAYSMLRASPSCERQRSAFHPFSPSEIGILGEATHSALIANFCVDLFISYFLSLFSATTLFVEPRGCPNFGVYVMLPSLNDHNTLHGLVAHVAKELAIVFNPFLQTVTFRSESYLRAGLIARSSICPVIVFHEPRSVGYRRLISSC
jgi:hypothetical protein